MSWWPETAMSIPPDMYYVNCISLKCNIICIFNITETISKLTFNTGINSLMKYLPSYFNNVRAFGHSKIYQVKIMVYYIKHYNLYKSGSLYLASTNRGKLKKEERRYCHITKHFTAFKQDISLWPKDQTFLKSQGGYLWPEVAIASYFKGHKYLKWIFYLHSGDLCTLSAKNKTEFRL